MGTRLLATQAKSLSTPASLLTAARPKPLQRRSSNQAETAPVPPMVYEVMGRPGRPLDSASREFMESRLGHDFSQVRVHTDMAAAESAQAIKALAYTVGRDVVFGSGEFAPGTKAGQRLLAHELTHVLQQGKNRARAAGGGLAIGNPSSMAELEARRSADQILAGGCSPLRINEAPVMLQRDNGAGGSSESEEDRYRLQWPGLGQGTSPRITAGPELELRVDPEIQAQIAAMRMVRGMLDPESIRSSLLRIDFSTLLATQPPPWLTAPPTPSPAPAVPRGAGPATARAATGGDVVRAILRIPAVDAALTRLRTEAADQVRSGWRELSGGERALVITHSAVLAAGALAGVLSSPEGRDFSLNLIQNRDIPIPGVPGLTFQFNVTGADQMIRFDLNVGALLPPSLGFR